MSDDLPYDDRVHSTLCDETISLYVSGRVVYVDCSGEERVTEYKLCARDFNIAPIFHFSDDGNEAT